MTDGANDVSNLLQECEAAAKGSLHNAQAHFGLADSVKKQGIWLSPTLIKELPREQLLAEVRRMDDRYITLCEALPPTSRKSFEFARKQIREGTHEPDVNERAR